MIASTPPEAYRSARPSDLLLGAYRDYVQKNGPLSGVLALVGHPGVGKTWDAAGIANLRRAGPHGAYRRNVWISCSTIDTVDRDDLHEAAMAGADAADRAYRDWLFLDDVGARLSEGAMTRIYEVLDLRAGRQLPTVVTLNGDESGRIDKRIRSRLYAGLVVDYTGLPDRRRQGAVVARLVPEGKTPVAR